MIAVQELFWKKNLPFFTHEGYSCTQSTASAVKADVGRIRVGQEMFRRRKKYFSNTVGGIEASKQI